MTRYAVELDDRAEDDIDREAFRLIGVLGQERALRWQATILQEIQTLAIWPLRYAIAEEDAPAFPGMEVRRLLVGTGRMIYRILYHVIEPQEEAEGIVRILRVRHSAMRPLGQPDEEES